MKQILIVFLLVVGNIASATPKVQLQISPVATLMGASNLEINYSFAEKFSIGFGGLRWESEIFDVDFVANEFHVIATYWKSGTFTDSWFGFIGYSNLGIQLTTNDSSGKEYTGEVDGSGTIIGSGYHWQWEHFNMQAGYSLGFYGFDSELELEASDGEKKDESIPLGTVGSLFYNIGWLF